MVKDICILRGRTIDEQEKLIIKALIRNPRSSDNQISKATRVPVRTVYRKRKKLEEEGIIHYYLNVNLDKSGIGKINARHLYLIKFKLGLPYSQFIQEINEEINVRTVFTDHIYQSFLAEVDGRVALVMILEGERDEDIVENFNKIIVPSLKKNHGPDSIEDVQTIRLSDPIRFFHNYMPMLNIKNGRIRDDWRDELLFIT